MPLVHMHKFHEMAVIAGSMNSALYAVPTSLRFNSAYKCAKRTRASQHFLSYKRKRNEVVKLMRKAKRNSFEV